MKKILLSIMFLVFFQLFSGCLNINKNDYVATVDGEKISIPEFKVYFYLAQKEFEATGDTDIWTTPFEGGMTAEELAKERALVSIAQIKISAKQAKKMNIFLTDEEKQKAYDDAKNFIDGLNEQQLKDIAIDEKLMINIMEQRELYSKVYDEITKSYEISEKDFEMNYNEYIKSQKDLSEADISNTLDIQYIRISMDTQDALQKANKVLQKAISGEDFTSLVKQYSDDKQNDGKETISKGKYIKEFEDTAYSLKEGQISDLIEINGSGYYIIKLIEIKEPDIKTKYRQRYIKQKKDDIFNQKYSTWSDSNKIEKNADVWGTIKRIEN